MTKNAPQTIEFKSGDEVIVPDGSGQPGGMTDLNDALTPLQAARLHDPGITNLIDTPEHPAPAAQTTDPHRITFMLPNSENTIFSLGEAAPHDAKHINNTGITGRTDQHVHFHTTDGELQTMLVLGHGASADEQLNGYKGNVLQRGNGFLVATEANAWISAKDYVYAVAREVDVVVRAAGEKGGPSVLVQSDEGPVYMRGEGVVLSGKNEVIIAANTKSEKLDPDYNARVQTTLVEESQKSWNEWATTGLEVAQIVTGVMDAVRGLAQERKEAQKENAGWKAKSWAEFAEIVVECAKMYKVLSGAFKAHETPGSVAMHAEHEIGISAAGGLELFAKMGAAIASTLGVDIIGATTGMKALTFAGVWAGINASVSAGNAVGISAGKEAKISGKKEVKITSKEVKIGASEAAIIQAPEEEGTAVLYGAHSAYVAAEGYGMKATKSNLCIGKLTSAAHFSKATPASTSTIQMTDDHINLFAKGAGVTLDGSNLKIFSKGDAAVFKLSDAGQVVGDASKILLG